MKALLGRSLVIDDKPLTPREIKELIKKVSKKTSWDNISKLTNETLRTA